MYNFLNVIRTNSMVWTMRWKLIKNIDIIYLTHYFCCLFWLSWFAFFVLRLSVSISCISLRRRRTKCTLNEKKTNRAYYLKYALYCSLAGFVSFLKIVEIVKIVELIFWNAPVCYWWFNLPNGMTPKHVHNMMNDSSLPLK